jgi:hypothetical protein
LSEVGPLQLGPPQISVLQVGVHQIHIREPTVRTTALLQQNNQIVRPCRQWRGEQQC